MNTNTATSTQREKNVQRVILIEGSANVAVLLAKLWVGLSTGSLAILGDAIHSLTDVTNNIIAWVVIRLSAQPPDREHPYGHRKFETLAVFFLAALLVVLAFELALQAIRKEDEVIASSTLELGIMLGVLIVNISLASWQRMWARRLESDLIMADASHTFSDVLITLTVIIGWQLSAMGYPWLDRACALGVSGVIFYLAYSLYKRAMPILVDEFALDPELLTRTIRQVAGVIKVNRVRSRWIGTDKAIDIVICVDPELSTEESHTIATEIEKLIEQKFGVTDISIHVEPFGQ
ncbi:MAG: cation diffusion facilitator family transporter [Gammaproteobacteria bacterium]|nr:cation diffusion facilitator family transporter [Gammaproteobacteria bacterium]MCW8922970.1 cation diffusion facilitator family transporter [Gammaproteobacteria bacterium]